MIIYVAAKYGGDPANIERAKKITHDLQVADLENTYVCPLLMFSHLRYGEIDYDAEMELCLDILSSCDKLIIASEITNGVRREIDFAKLVKMEAVKLEEDGALRPIAV